MKTYRCVALFATLIFTIPMFGQLDVLAEWPLNSTVEATPTTIANVQAADFVRGNGINKITYSSLGARANYWPTTTETGIVDYYEVCLTPDPGITLEVNQLEFSESRTTDGPGAFEVHWSLDGFETQQLILGQAIPDNTDERKHTIPNLDIDICNGRQLCFRFSAYRSEVETGEWKLGSNSLKVRGEKRTACAPPNTNGAVAFDFITDNTLTVNLTHGNGTGRVVVMREGSPVSSASAPCNGLSYVGDDTFGQGDQLAPGEYVVYAGTGAAYGSSSFTVDGLTDGATYHLTVFEYDGTCYKQQGALNASASTSCSAPNFVRNLIHSGTNNKISFLWDLPYCFDEVLIVAGYSPITGFPTGDGSQYSIDAEFGLGNGGSDFGVEEFPIYLGTADRLETSGVQNNNEYHFSFFVRKGTDWVEAKRVTTQPAQGCSDLGGGDNLFINEIEYETFISGPAFGPNLDIDEGIEIAGQAGVNLDAYEVHVYKVIPTDTKESTVERIIPLSGKIEDQQNGMGAFWVPIPDIENTHGWAIYNKVTQTVVQFLSVLRPLEAIDGVANGMIADQTLGENNGGDVINIVEHGSSAFNKTIQLQGTGGCPGDFLWVSETTQSRGELNTTQAFVPLPIELLSFGARAVEKQVVLHWETLTEINNDYMAVERSVDGLDFQEIGLINGAGTSFIPQSYELVDPKPYQGINYYRLRQVDFDGTTTYSKMVSVVFEGQGWGIQVFPSLTKDFVNVRLDQATDQQGIVHIFDLNGTLRHRQVLEAGSLGMGLNISHLNAGHFIVRIERGSYTTTHRIVKL